MLAFTSFNSLVDIARKTLPYIKSGRVALSGGSTYALLMQEWAQIAHDLSATEFFPVDERIVPFSSDMSNWGVAQRIFLSNIGRSADAQHWAQSVDEYKKLLAAWTKDTIPSFDTVFLGVGDDGHTASLFPCTNDVDNMVDVVLATKSPKAPFDRVTLGSAVFAVAKKVVVIVGGSGKKPIVARMLADDMELPIVRVLQRCRNPEIFIEASLL